jgi:hypothetical protein
MIMAKTYNHYIILWEGDERYIRFDSSGIQFKLQSEVDDQLFVLHNSKHIIAISENFKDQCVMADIFDINGEKHITSFDYDNILVDQIGKNYPLCKPFFDYSIHKQADILLSMA